MAQANVLMREVKGFMIEPSEQLNHFKCQGEVCDKRMGISKQVRDVFWHYLWVMLELVMTNRTKVFGEQAGFSTRLLLEQSVFTLSRASTWRIWKDLYSYEGALALFYNWRRRALGDGRWSAVG